MVIMICDDDYNILETIYKKAKEILKYQSDYHLYKSTKPEDVIKVSNDRHIDILLIDIEMPSMNGFELIEKLGIRNKKPIIIFISNIDTYVYESFKYHPYRFIRKTHLDELREALESSVQLIRSRTEIFKIKLTSLQYKELYIQDIIYIESIHNNVKVLTKQGNEYIYRETLKNLEIKFKDKGFVRIHSGFLLNIKYVRVINKVDVEVKYNNLKFILPVSRGQYGNLVQKYQYYLR